MKKQLQFLLMGALLLVCGFHKTFAKPVSIDGIAAVVNNSIITQSQINAQVTRIKKQFQKSGEPIPSNAEIRTQILNQMVDQELQLQIAKKMKLKVTDEELKKATESIARNNHFTMAELHQALQQEGIDFKTYQKDLKRQILIQKAQSEALGQDIKIEERDVTAAVAELAKKANQDRKYHLLDILVPLDDDATPQQTAEAKTLAENLLKKINSGISFQSLVEKTEDPSYQGVDLGWRSTSEIPSIFSETIHSMEAGQIRGPIQASNGFHLIKLESVKGQNLSPSEQQDLQMRARDLVFQQKLDAKLEDWLKELKRSSYIKLS